MSTTTITMSAGTWCRTSDNVNHSSDSWLRSSLFPYYNSTDAGGNFAILQFTIPNTLKYKQIKKVQLSYYTKHIIGGSEQSGRAFNGLTVSPYLASGTALSNVAGSTVDTYGEVGTPVKISPYEDWTGAIYPLWRTQDITALFESNLYNNQYFSIILYSAPGGPSERVTVSPSQYAAIGGVGSSYAAYLTIDYDDVAQAPPTPSYPVGAYVNENTDLLFAWAWNSSTQAVQAAVQLEYKLASSSTWTVVNLTQSSHSYTLSGGLPQGAYQWRIKGTNDAAEVSDYSAVAEFTVIGKPGVPVINTPTNAALTTITWQASDQNSYDITLTDSNGRELINEMVASSATSYKPNMLLKGTYTVGIRYRNSSGLSSDWAYKVFSITAAGPTKPTFILYGDAENARIAVTRNSSLSYVVLRAEDSNLDFKVLGKMTADTYIDKTAKFNTSYSYKVRAYASAGYTDSDAEHIVFKSSKVAIQTEDIDIFLDRSESEFLPYSEDVAREMATYKCPGRQYAIVEHIESDECLFSTSLFATEEQKESLTKIAREDYIYYRDYSGRAFPVAISRLNFSRYMNIGYIANIEFIRIAEKEVVVNV